MGNNLPYVNLGTGRTAKALALGQQHSCALLDNDRVKCWGRGQLGYLGSGSQFNLGHAPETTGDGLPYVDVGSGRTVKTLHTSGTGEHTCVVLDNDGIKCWGSGGYGKAGIGVGQVIPIGYAPEHLG